MFLRVVAKIGTERLRKFFWIVALLAVTLNLFDDVEIFIRNRLSQNQNQRMNLAQSERRDFEHLVTLFLNENWNAPEVQMESRNLIAKLAAAAKDDPKLEGAIAHLAELMKTTPPILREGMRPYRTAIFNVRSQLDERLRATMQRNFNEDERTEIVVLSANIVDLTIIFLLLASYFLERRLKDDIEESLARSIDDLRSTNRRLEELTDARSRQLRIAAHDIKSPLAALKSYSEIAQGEVTSGQPIESLLKRMDALTNSTLDMVNSLFSDVKPVQARHRANVNVEKVLAEVCASSLPLAMRKGQHIEVTGGGSGSAGAATIEGNRSELMTCFYNLLNNAIKFSPTGGKIKIDWQSIHDQIRVRIADEGPGFRKEDFAHLFEEGGTLSARPTGGESSSGYGLYSTKKIIESHHGNIQVRNAPGRGAIIDIRLPK